MSTTTTLHDAVARHGTVVTVDLPDAPRRRLAELGLRAGAIVAVVQGTAGRGVVVDVAGSRVALDRATARRITVQVAS